MEEKKEEILDRVAVAGPIIPEGKRTICCQIPMPIWRKAKELGMKWAMLIEFGLDRNKLTAQLEELKRALAQEREERMRREENTARLQTKFVDISEKLEKANEHIIALENLLKAKGI